MAATPLIRIERHLPSAASTEALGEALGRRLTAGQGLALVGELGAGKTCIARGVGRGLGLDDPDAVSSPTYLLVVEHPGPTPMIHIDAYLPGKSRAFLLDGGLDYLAEAAGVVVVEWAERVLDLLPEETLWLALAPAPGAAGGRSAVLRAESPVFRWVESLGGFPPGA